MRSLLDINGRHIVLSLALSMTVVTLLAGVLWLTGPNPSTAVWMVLGSAFYCLADVLVYRWMRK